MIGTAELPVGQVDGDHHAGAERVPQRRRSAVQPADFEDVMRPAWREPLRELEDLAWVLVHAHFERVVDRVCGRRVAHANLLAAQRRS